MCAWLPYKETTRRAEVPERARARPGHARNVLAVSTHCQMPSSSSFSVKPQPAQENQNPHGYSTQPAFFMPGSKAAGAQSRRKKKTLAPLAPLAEANQMMEGCSYSFGSNNYGLMTPETPSTIFLVTNMNYGQQHGFLPMYPSAHGQGADISPYNSQRYISLLLDIQIVDCIVCISFSAYSGANLLFSAPNLCIKLVKWDGNYTVHHVSSRGVSSLIANVRIP